MILKYTKTLLFLIFIALTIFSTTGCKDYLDDHNELSDGILKENLLERLNSDPSLSKFVELLKKTGYDKIISSSRSFTIWAPTNEAIAGLDQSIMVDTARLRRFVAFHICNLSYLTTATKGDTIEVETILGKYAKFSKGSFHGAAITEGNLLASNGIVHKISSATEPKLNIWEYINSTKEMYEQNKFLYSQDTTVYDVTNAVKVGIDPKTGEPIYKAGTDSVKINRFLKRIANVNDEGSRYTFFVLDNATLTSEYNKWSGYFTSHNMMPDSSTNFLTKFALSGGLVVKGVYAKDRLPDTPLVSVTGIRLPIERSAIVASYQASNGVVHVINRINFFASDIVPTVYIQGENPSGFSTIKSSNIYYRTKVDSMGVIFKDIEAYGTGISLYHILYKASNLRAGTYKVYWRVVSGSAGDPQTGNFQQRLNIGSAGSNTFPYITVTPLNYKEVYIGDYTRTEFGSVNLYLVSAASTASGTNTLILDYLKFVPVL